MLSCDKFDKREEEQMWREYFWPKIQGYDERYFDTPEDEDACTKGECL